MDVTPVQVNRMDIDESTDRNDNEMMKILNGINRDTIELNLDEEPKTFEIDDSTKGGETERSTLFDEGWVNKKACQVHSKLVELHETSTVEGAELLTQSEICETVLGQRMDEVTDMCYIASAKRAKCSLSSSTIRVTLHERKLSDKITSLRMVNQELKDSLKKCKEEIAQNEEATQKQRNKMQAEIAEELRKMDEGDDSCK